MIKKESLQFIKDLSTNNNRDWFTENKSRYTACHENFIEFANALLAEMNKHDNIETPNGKKSLFRIYRDVRFSKNKDPYKSWMSGSFKRATAALRGGYYYHFEPGNFFIGGGFWGPSSDDLKHIRAQIAADPERFEKAVKDKKFTKTFGALSGDQVKTAPKGYAKDHPAIEFLRFKQFLGMKKYSEKEALSKDFVQIVNNDFKNIRPFFDYMSDILTTDLNGESLLN
ncbi:MAG: DUF2461 domain-containing protein [Flavobacteriales bacterium]|nr:DUF2461 domain-containing protein [Flavobacteriales bacterium]